MSQGYERLRTRLLKLYQLDQHGLDGGLSLVKYAEATQKEEAAAAIAARAGGEE